MKIQQMQEIRNSRHNLVGFLDAADHVKIRELTCLDTNVPFWVLADAVINEYEAGRITNKAASEVFEILKRENTSIRTEKYRFETGSLFAFDSDANAYIYDRKISKTDFRKFYSNQYVD